MSYDIIFEGKFYKDGEIKEGCIGVEGGVIKKIAKSIEGSNRFRVEGTILPAMVDIHVHFREPGYTEKEDFLSGSMCAALGGVSFVADMPNNRPRIDTWQNFQDKLERIRKRSYVDYELYAEISSRTDEYLIRNHNLFKVYMTETPLPSITEKLELLESNDIVSFHCEKKECIDENITPRNLYEYCFARPESCEVEAVRDVIEIKKSVNKHIAHVSTIDSVDLAIAYDISMEITPHHMLFDYNEDLGAFGKVNPPIRGPGTREALFRSFVRGEIKIVASDHAPHTLDEKEEFESAPPGMPGVETTYPILLNLYREGKISLERLIDAVSQRPSELLGIKKGRIEEGYHADFIAIRLGDWTRITERNIHYKCGWSPYIGFYAVFPRMVVIRGEIVVDDFEISAEPLGVRIKV